MKKRIIAFFLAFTVFVGVFSVPKRARAAAAGAVAIVSIGVLAWEILDIMIKGEEPAIIVGIRTLIESGVDALTNPDSYFQQTYGDFWKDFGGGYEAIYSQVLEMYENGEISISNGRVDLTYEQYLELYKTTLNYVSDFGLNFTTPYSFFGFDYSLGYPAPILGMPSNDIFVYSSEGESYFLCFYNDNKAVFADNYIVIRKDLSTSWDCLISGRYLYSDYDYNTNGFGFTVWKEDLDRILVDFYYSSLSELVFLWHPAGSTNDFTTTCPAYGCFVFENGEMTYSPVSSVDVSGCHVAIVSTTGDYGAFLQSISGISTSEPVAAQLDDLSTVLPVDDSPVLSIPINPDLSVPIPDQVTVSVPGANDIPLTDYMDPLITDIEAPSALATKFPFCIPFDFIRIISVLAADPIPPVFHIPISTHPTNLEGFADNETIGEFVAPDDPMFDIDEEIVIDFAHIPLVQAVSYSIFLIGFVIMLIKLTPKLIQH